MSAKRYELNAARRRERRVRGRIRASGRLRMSVFRSARHIYVQVVDDARGNTLVTASSLEKSIKKGTGRAGAEAVGKLLAKRAVQAGITEVAFDRGRYPYHGRVRALAEAVRAGGLKF